MKLIVISLLVGVMFLAISACGQDTPDEGDGRAVLESAMNRRGCMELMDFDQTEGQGYEFGGANFFRMEYAADIRLSDGCHGAYGSKNQKFWRFPRRYRSVVEDRKMQALGYQLVNGGDVVRVTGRIEFEQQGKDWVRREHIF